MPVMLESCEPTKSGKAWRVKLGGNYYNAFKDSGIENYVGQMIEAEITTSEKYGPAVAAFRPVAGQATSTPPPIRTGYTAPPTAPHKEPVYAEPAKAGTVAPFWWPSVSNVWAAAITAGLIKSANDLEVWAQGVYMAATKNRGDSDDIPF